MKDIIKFFGNNVRLLRKQKGLSQEKLAKLAGVHTTYIGQIERGEKKCTLEVADKIAVALGTSLSTMLDDGTNKSRAEILAETEKEVVVKELQHILKLIRR